MTIKLDVGFPYFVTDRYQINEMVRALDSISSHVHRIWAIDGRFKEFPYKTDYSIGGVSQILKMRYRNLEIVDLCANQQEKRQAYLDLAEDCDYLMVMDSDDYVHPDHQDWDLFYKQLEEHYQEEDMLYFMWFWVDPDFNLNSNPITPNTWQKWIRLHKHPSRQKYYMNHYTWRMKEDNSINLNSLVCKKTLGGIKLTSDSKYRSEEFKKQSAIWVEENWKVEQAKTWVAFNKLEQLSNVVFPKK